MITASHNKYNDNGFKLAAFKGESIPADWEEFFTNLVNSTNLIDFIKYYLLFISEKNKIQIEKLLTIKGLICYAYDTRPSSKEFNNIIE